MEKTMQYLLPKKAIQNWELPGRVIGSVTGVNSRAQDKILDEAMTDSMRQYFDERDEYGKTLPEGEYPGAVLMVRTATKRDCLAASTGLPQHKVLRST